MYIPCFPLTKHKYKTKTSSHTLFFVPHKLNIIASSQTMNTSCGGHYLQAKCDISVCPFFKADWCSYQCMRYFFLEPSSPSFLKMSHQILSNYHVSCRYPNNLFLMKSLPFHHFFFKFCIWFSYYWGCLLPHISNDLYKVKRWPNHLLAIGHNVFFINGFSYLI